MTKKKPKRPKPRTRTYRYWAIVDSRGRLHGRYPVLHRVQKSAIDSLYSEYDERVARVTLTVEIPPREGER